MINTVCEHTTQHTQWIESYRLLIVLKDSGVIF